MTASRTWALAKRHDAVRFAPRRDGKLQIEGPRFAKPSQAGHEIARRERTNLASAMIQLSATIAL
jgi:hypothetical protein